MPHNYRQELQQLLTQLTTQRDELAVKAHLAKAELRDQWNTIEKQWATFKSQSEGVLQDVDKTSIEVKATLAKLAAEIKEGYTRIKNRL